MDKTIAAFACGGRDDVGVVGKEGNRSPWKDDGGNRDA
jgi:hypothetical protein